MKTSLTVLSIPAISLLLTSLASGQVATTSLHGTVYDVDGAVVPQATVTLTSPSTGFTRSSMSDGQGVYQFLQIPPATYDVSSSAPGFAETKVSNLQLLVNSPATQNLTLSVAAAKTVVEVQGQIELVNTQDASIGNAFESKQILNLPFEGRDPVGILSLQPGVAYVGNNVDQSYDSRGGSVNGARSDQTNVTLDGVDDNDQNLGNAFTGALRSTLDSLEEFRVVTSNNDADSGRSSGAQVSLVTKSGTNNFHGSLYEYNRSNIGEANDWFNEQAQIRSGLRNVPGQLIRNTFGAAVGGPIIKNKLFFFATYEGQRTRESLQVTRVVPSLLLRSGILQYIDVNGNLQQLDPADILKMDPVVKEGVNPAALKVLQTYPIPNSTAAGDGLNFVGYTFAASTPSKLDTYIVKLDANLTQRQQIYVRGNLQNDSLVNPDAGSAPQFPGQPANITNRNNAKGLAIGHVWTVTNNVINNARYGYVRTDSDFAGLQTQHHVYFLGLDTPQGESSTQTLLPPVHNFIDDVSWKRGNHTLQFGGNWRIINDIRSSNDLSFLSAETNPSWLTLSGFAGTGQSLDPGAFDFPAVSSGFGGAYNLSIAALAGVVSQGFSNYNRTKTGSVLAEGVPADRHFKSNELETYLQDSWRVRRNLTVTFGARYTLLQPPYETTGLQVGTTTSLHDWFDQRAISMEQGQPYAPLLTFGLIGKANGGRPYWNWDHKNVAPRFAVAWSPSRTGNDWLSKIVGSNGKTSVRAGFGIYYDHFGEGIVNSFDALGSFGLTTQLQNASGVLSPDTAPRFTGFNNLPPSCPSGCVMIPAPASGFPVTPPSTPNTGGFAVTWGMDNKIQTPYSEVFDFSLTRELPSGFVVEASYIGRMAHHLLQEEDLAMPLDLRDPASGMDYFTAGTLLSKAFNAGTNIANLAPIKYWEDLFPGAAGNFGFGPPSGGSSSLGCAPGNSSFAGKTTATQAIYDMWSCYVGNETSALFNLDLPGYCVPSCSKFGPYAYFDSQYSSLYAWRSIGNSAYNGLQLMLRHKGHGLDVDFNYTYSKSIDAGSNAERVNQYQGAGFASQVINSWSPGQLRAVSDFDTTHQFNSNWVYELPVGRGKHFASELHGIGQALLGGWTISGIFRLTSGYPFTVKPGLGFWATNWEETSADFLTGPAPTTGVFTDPSGNPNVFKGNPLQVGTLFRHAYPGESGQRNSLRGPGYFGIDSGLAKVWNVTERQLVRFSWEVFNVTNTPRMDVGQLQNYGNNQVNTGPTFGEYGQTLTKPRIMQFALRYSF